MNNYKVLLIEDDAAITEMYQTRFEEAGIKLVAANDGEAGLEAVKKELPMVILLDIMMPRMDGFAVLSSLKKDKVTKDIPVFMLSNLGQKADIEKGKKLGANDYIVKASMTPTQVINKIKPYLK